MMNYPNFNYQQPIPPQQNLYQMPYQGINSIQNMPGKVVDDFNAISVNDVPMDGSASVFLKRDLSEIQVRKWGSDGRIYSTLYKPYTEELNVAQANNQDNNISALNERLQAIEDKIDKLIKPAAVKKGSSDVNS